jgi:hypothetical protein
MRYVGGACCAAVMVCASGAWGMDEEDLKFADAENVTETHSFQSDLDIFRPITLDFSRCVSSCSDSNWRRAFSHIVPNVSLLLSEQYPGNISYAYCAVRDVCAGFNIFSRLCASFSDDQVFRSDVLPFIKLASRVFHDPRFIDSGLEKKFVDLYDRATANSADPIVDLKDKELFSDAMFIMDDLFPQQH